MNFTKKSQKLFLNILGRRSFSTLNSGIPDTPTSQKPLNKEKEIRKHYPVMNDLVLEQVKKYS